MTTPSSLDPSLGERHKGLSGTSRLCKCTAEHRIQSTCRLFDSGLQMYVTYTTTRRGNQAQRSHDSISKEHRRGEKRSRKKRQRILLKLYKKHDESSPLFIDAHAPRNLPPGNDSRYTQKDAPETKQNTVPCALCNDQSRFALHFTYLLTRHNINISPSLLLSLHSGLLATSTRRAAQQIVQTTGVAERA